MANASIGQTTTGKKPAQVRPEQYKAATLVPQTLSGMEKMEAAKQITYSNNPIGVPQTVREFTETIIGTTFYDLQTNNAIPHWFYPRLSHHLLNGNTMAYHLCCYRVHHHLPPDK